MSFISLKFAAFVILCLLFYYAVPKKWQWCVLLAASWYFYLLTGINRIFSILFTTASTYFFALLLEKGNLTQKAYLKDNRDRLSKDEKREYKAAMKKKQKWLLFICLFLNFSILVWFKYANLAIAHLNLFRLNRFGNTDFIPFFNLILPLGISFYTFQSMGYLIDIYYGKYGAEHSFFKFALYVSYFPQIIQGPISRFGELAKDNSADSNASDGGIYENVVPNQMVSTFNAWCFDSKRKEGDTAIVQTEYGYHIMYFV